MSSSLHPEPVVSGFRPAWESLGQVDPSELPEPSVTYPGPWRLEDRGNGHEDVFDASGRLFAHVYCYAKEDFAALMLSVRKSIDNPVDKIYCNQVIKGILCARVKTKDDAVNFVSKNGSIVLSDDDIWAIYASWDRFTSDANLGDDEPTEQ